MRCLTYSMFQIDLVETVIVQWYNYFSKSRLYEEVIIMDENKVQLFEDQKIRTAWDEEKRKMVFFRY